jgi:YbbR domain-containing protein
VGSRFPIRFGTANLARLILSLIIAFAIWAFVTNERDPDRSQVFQNLEVSGAETIPPQFQIVDPIPEVSVAVKGPESVVRTITAATIQPRIDLSKISSPGRHEIPVEVNLPDGLRDIEVLPETIQVNVGTVVEREMEITIVDPPSPPATLTSISLSTTTVKLVGVEQNVNRVERVEVRVVLSGRTESFSFIAQPVPFASNGENLSELVRVEPQSIQITVEFEVRSLSVPVIVTCACQDADGQLQVRDLPTAIAIPSTVRIEGPSQLLSQVQEVRTLPITISELEVSGFVPNGAELDVSTLPDGVTLDRQSIDVWVEVEQQVSSFENRIMVINQPENTTIELDEETVTFDIQAPAELMLSMQNEPPTVVIDLAGLEPGTHAISPRVVLPADARVINLQPTLVTVTIQEIVPTPTPTIPPPPPTIAPEPTVGASSQVVVVIATATP